MEIPKSLSLLPYLALGATLLAPVNHEVTDATSHFSFGIMDAMATPKPTVEILIEGAQRTVHAEGTDLNVLHSLAYQSFISQVESEVQVPGAQLRISDFQTEVTLADGQYHFEYRVKLLHCEDPTQANHLVDMRGTVWSGEGAKEQVLRINANKIPQWQQSMKESYPDRNIHFQMAQSQNGLIFHEAVLVVGN